MKSILILLILGLLSHSLKAQSVITPALPDTLDISETVEVDQMTFNSASEEPFTGIVTSYYPTGQLKLRRSVINGKAEGVWLEWYESGIIRYIAEWKEGKGHGVWMYFHENGELSERSVVLEDVWDGVTESWYENGQKASQGVLSKNKRSGEWTFWNEDGTLKDKINYDSDN